MAPPHRTLREKRDEDFRSRPLALLSSGHRSGVRASPSETRVKRGLRFVRGGEKELLEKLGRNDPCPCGSGKRFQALLYALRSVSMAPSGIIIGDKKRCRSGTSGTCPRKALLVAIVRS